MTGHLDRHGSDCPGCIDVRTALLRSYEATADFLEASARRFAARGMRTAAQVEQREATRARWKAMGLRKDGEKP